MFSSVIRFCVCTSILTFLLSPIADRSLGARNWQHPPGALSQWQWRESTPKSHKTFEKHKRTQTVYIYFLFTPSFHVVFFVFALGKVWYWPCPPTLPNLQFQGRNSLPLWESWTVSILCLVGNQPFHNLTAISICACVLQLPANIGLSCGAQWYLHGDDNMQKVQVC